MSFAEQWGTIFLILLLMGSSSVFTYGFFLSVIHVIGYLAKALSRSAYLS